ncbi:MAG: family protein phosphatase [Thermoleophilaceae bacterium]|nr:family protein phosphatase [Thermoleophilaceae bacterium]
MTPPIATGRQRQSDVHHRRVRTQPRQRVRALPLAVVEQAALSDRGLRRANNEDSFLVGTRLFAVADGVGGNSAGEVASRLAVDALAAGAEGAHEPADLRRLANSAATAVHDGQAKPDQAGMATTLTAALVSADGLAIAHAGDSRMYRLRAGTMERLTEDHSFVGQLVRSGRISAAEAERHPLRSVITRALGRDPDVDYATTLADASAGDVFLICSDGLTGMIGEDDMAAILERSGSLPEAALRLVRAANEAGGRDNVTVVLFRVGIAS